MKALQRQTIGLLLIASGLLLYILVRYWRHIH
jgi:hypothetical protein